MLVALSVRSLAPKAAETRQKMKSLEDDRMGCQERGAPDLHATH